MPGTPRITTGRPSSTGHPSGSTPPSGLRRCSAIRSSRRTRRIDVIEAMVQADPSNYRVYLERGRYRRRFDLEGAEDDFQKSLELAPDQAETYLEAAQLAEQKSGLDAARQILDKGLQRAPESPKLYLALADLERRDGRMDESIKVMEDASGGCPSRSRSASSSPIDWP